MPHSVDEAAQTAELLERKAHDAIEELHLKDAVAMLGAALAIREAYQGEAHPDLIWTLSLWIYALRREHRPESALEAAAWVSGVSCCVGPLSLALRTSWRIRSES